jgi:hypothetical protein
MALKWVPKIRKLEDDILQEEAKLEALRLRRLFRSKQVTPEPRPSEPTPLEQIKPPPVPEKQFIPPAPEEEMPAFPPTPELAPPPQQIEPAPRLTPPPFRWMPREPKTVPPSVIPTVARPTEKAEWYEQPKVWGEKAMEAVGRGISKVPILPPVLEKIAPAFEFIHEKLEKPFAAIITAPWSPSLPWRAGESWLEHQKREYETWAAPTYVKGAAEFAMPLWWMPWLGWAAKGAKALGVGNKMTRALATLPKAGKVRLPSNQVLDDTLFKQDFFRRIALWSENKPFLSGVVRAVGGAAAFVRGADMTPVGIVKRAIVKRAVIADMRHGVRGLLMPKLQKYRDPIKLLQISDEGLVGVVRPKVKGASRGLSAVFEHPENYRFMNKEAKAFVKDARSIINEIYELAAQEGVKVPKELMFHRIVRGKYTKEMVLERSEYGSLFEVARHHKTMEQGIKAGVVYGNNPLESIESTINHYIRKIAQKRFDDEVGKLGKTPLEKFATLFPDDAIKIAELSATASSADYALRAIASIFSRKGTSLPPATMRKIRSGLPEVAERLDALFAIAPPEVDSILAAMSKELWRALKINPKEFKILLAQFNKTPGRILLREIDDTIRSLNISNATAEKAIANIYKTAYRSRKQYIDDTLRAIQQDLKATLEATRAELAPLKQTRTQFLKRYREGKYILGEGEAKFTWHPAFRGKIFPKEVVELAEPALRDAGNKWLRGMEAASGTSRMLVAALDFSAPFIQGLAVLGRNPVAWAKAVAKQFEFFAKPENLYKYMDDPINMALRAERIAFGGSSRTWEYFEALAPLQRTIGKVPVAGKAGRRAIRETYGRAEAAFSGFGEVARNEMWKALRRPNMSEAQLRELARTIDRMTGVMSTEALAIGLTQRQLENAWVFFAPRYTRAGLAYVSDIFKGGIAGAEARKSLGALMASGFAMYYGTCAALGQTPNLDPRSARFLTIKVGEHHLGVGGILYALMRLASGVATTAAEEPLDLVRLNRFDNPFIRFMYSRTAPLTGLSVGLAIEHKNFFGEPFESPADYGKFLADKVIPIAFQDIMPWEKRKITAPVFASELMGGRTFPKSAWELREEARDRYAMQQYGHPYDALPELYKREIDKMPEIQMLQEESDRRTVYRGKALSVAFLNRQRERDDARFMYEQNLWQAQRAVDAGLISPYDFRELLQQAGYGLGMTYQHIDSRPEYKEVMQKLKEPKDVSKDYIGDIAYDELVEALYSGRFEDEYGLFNYEAYNKFRENLRRKYGDAVYEYILAREAQRRENLPPLAQLYYKAREVMKPYWDIAKRVERLMGKTFANSTKGQALISKLRRDMRVTSPEIQNFYELFYSKN